MSFYHSGQQMPLFPTQRLRNVTCKHLPNGQKYITKEEITEVRLTDGYRTSETHEYPEPYHCANPYGMHRYVVVMDGDNGHVDKEKGIALCFDCLRIRFPHRFGHQLPMPPAQDVELDLRDLYEFMDSPSEEPLPPLREECESLSEVKKEAMRRTMEEMRRRGLWGTK